MQNKKFINLIALALLLLCSLQSTAMEAGKVVDPNKNDEVQDYEDYSKNHIGFLELDLKAEWYSDLYFIAFNIISIMAIAHLYPQPEIPSFANEAFEYTGSGK